MSKYKQITTEFKTADSLAKALIDLGYKVEVGQNAKVNNLGMYGYHGDLRPEKAAIVVRREHVGFASNDVGFAWDGSKYTAIISEYDQGGNFDAKRLDALKQRYSLHEIRRQAQIKGYTVRETTDQGGTIRLTLVHH